MKSAVHFTAGKARVSLKPASGLTAAALPESAMRASRTYALTTRSDRPHGLAPARWSVPPAIAAVGVARGMDACPVRSRLDRR